jgi:hypothetical protein
MEFGLVVTVGDGADDGPSVELSPEERPPSGDTLGVELPAKEPLPLVAGAPPFTPVDPYFLFVLASEVILASQSGLP